MHGATLIPLWNRLLAERQKEADILPWSCEIGVIDKSLYFWPQSSAWGLQTEIADYTLISSAFRRTALTLSGWRLGSGPYQDNSNEDI